MIIGSLFFNAVDIAGVELGTLELIVVILVAIGALALGIYTLLAYSSSSGLAADALDAMSTRTSLSLLSSRPERS